ncbi:phage portal protein [Marinilactibacillus psychrotolerans]|uniref:Phage portal protein n=1 Tax=Marinilactibacillus psychrotolerans TaxID=191770 RepID=A0A5R9C425_9LACT|nr:phage portal protein [Marinilactibacillus psychrotolerans]TLQ07574.1 phage portal protein [Marinilactibacillus psychrotolerans]
MVSAYLELEEHKVFHHPADEEITGDVVDKFVKLHMAKLPRYRRLKKLYESKGPILEQEGKAEYKPDNRLVVNNAKEIVDSYNGFFIGVPVKVTHQEQTVTKFVDEFRKRNSLDDVESEASKLSAIYGHSYIYVFQNEESETCVTFNSPLDMFIVYDDTIQEEPLFAVRYKPTDTGYEGQLFIKGKELYILNDATGTILTELDEDQDRFYYNDIQIIEWKENEERTSVFEPVETLINAMNKALSSKMNDIDYFADAYLAVLGADLDSGSLQDIRDNRIINLFGTDNIKDIVVKFLDKPDGDTSQENFLDRVERLIYEKSMIANINDESFGNASGVALEFKLQPMKNLAINKERKVKVAMKRMYKLIFSVPLQLPNNMIDEWKNLNFTFTRNIPRNVSDEAETAGKLQGVVSKETQLSVLSIVDNVQEEIERINTEREEKSVIDMEQDENGDFVVTQSNDVNEDE